MLVAVFALWYIVQIASYEPSPYEKCVSDTAAESITSPLSYDEMEAKGRIACR